MKEVDYVKTLYPGEIVSVDGDNFMINVMLETEIKRYAIETRMLNSYNIIK